MIPDLAHRGNLREDRRVGVRDRWSNPADRHSGHAWHAAPFFSLAAQNMQSIIKEINRRDLAAAS
jgi:hypothetical protein